MEEQLISMETAKLAKEKGFDYPCLYAYCEVGGLNICTGKKDPIEYILRTDANPLGKYCEGRNWNIDYGTNANKIICSAPTQSLLQKWLRDECSIFVWVRPYKDPSGDNNDPIVWKCNFTTEEYETYEEALELALQEALKQVNI